MQTQWRGERFFVIWLTRASKHADDKSDEWISIQTHSSVLCCVQRCRKIAQHSSHFYFHRRSRSHFQFCTLLHLLANVEFIFGWFNSCENSSRLLFWISPLCSLAWQWLRSAVTAINCYSDKSFSHNGHRATGLAFIRQCLHVEIGF